LESLLTEIPQENAVRLGLDNYEATENLRPCPVDGSKSIWLAVGAERGWSGDERDQLRANGFTLKHLGKRVLRVETAVVAALGILSTDLKV
jgi:RsmE family RNA methyltransferase